MVAGTATAHSLLHTDVTASDRVTITITTTRTSLQSDIAANTEPSDVWTVGRRQREHHALLLLRRRYVVVDIHSRLSVVCLSVCLLVQGTCGQYGPNPKQIATVLISFVSCTIGSPPLPKKSQRF